MTFSAAGDPGTTAATWRDELAGRTLPPVALDGLSRVVVVAAHPDDETLGAGGLVSRAHGAGLDVVVVVATRGERCHPHSPTHPPERLAELRAVELDEAVSLLSPGTRPELLGMPDGGVARCEDELVARLVALVGDGRRTLLVAPWRHDAHPDHEAAGRAAATTAARTGARLLEYPVWFWHWAMPVDAPWGTARRLDLDPVEWTTKQAAVAAHRTQVAPLSPEPGDEALLTPAFLEHFAAPYEVFWEVPPTDGALESLHEATADPWGVDRRWYERRKRAVLLAMLPRPGFRRGLEVGCSTGALAAELAERCGSLVALDASPSAIARATRRLSPYRHVEVRRGTVPDTWPAGAHDLDLVVVSEVGYFLSHQALEGLARRIVDSLAPDGVVMLCHWRHDIVGWPLDGPAVHAALLSAGLPPVAADYRDRDVEILVLTGAEQLPNPHE